MDIITLAGGLLLIVAPNWTYNAFRTTPPEEVPADWPRKSRIFGAIFLVVGLIFLYNTLFGFGG